MASPPTNAPRLAFAGTPEFAGTLLRALLDAGYPVEWVLTQPDRPAGRGRKVRPSPVKALAEARGLAVATPPRLRDAEFLERLRALQLDALVVVAYGLLLPPAMLALPRHGCINVHASLLPRWRGAAPVERAIMAGDTQSGVSIMQMDAGLDTGPVYLQRALPIGDDATGDSVHVALAELGADCLLEVLPQLGRLQPVPQPAGGASYAPKLTPADAIIDWRRSAAEIARQVRALNSRMPALTLAGDERMRVLLGREIPARELFHRAPPGELLAADREGLLVQCGRGCLRITRLQLSRGKGRPLDARAALNGYPELFRPGVVFRAPA